MDHPCGWQISPWPARKVTEESSLYLLRHEKKNLQAYIVNELTIAILMVLFDFKVIS